MEQFLVAALLPSINAVVRSTPAKHVRQNGEKSLNLDKRSPEILHLSVPSDTEVLMEINKSSTKGPATENVQEAAKILKPSIRIESGGIQTTKEVEDVILLSKKGNQDKAIHQ
ncbi:hypothetical protein TNIN_356811 [Trichonephila inaurata madagascariensis]|uniref:Uncharacterized protein n=1 Tax=Trichonephila inaurata madagascariensis TaxID=2747483 RepID=A0A8X6J3Z6_9ARAC|nr:hypothetical protein TNIN_356811 [Trichonephila inaurata madagascariensis]